jgi:hypothetical protein
MSITYSVCVFAGLVIQHTMRMRRVIFSSVACPAVSYFPTLSRKRHDFWKGVIKRKMCLFILTKTFVRKISQSKKN